MEITRYVVPRGLSVRELLRRAKRPAKERDHLVHGSVRARGGNGKVNGFRS
ncbi:hypothetical protein ACFVJH_32980 [Streptomyces decoyicus]|uniref:hypothetical protein n=1 Tax=Streptomyces decoyicus TaxID=249567 RepID=UPI0036449C83